MIIFMVPFVPIVITLWQKVFNWVILGMTSQRIIYRIMLIITYQSSKVLVTSKISPTLLVTYYPCI